jgi:Ca2+/Na+ antiporter
MSEDNIKLDSNSFIPAETAGIKSLDEQVKEINLQITSIRNESKNVIIGVLIAAFLIIVAVSIEVILFHSRTSDENKVFQKEFYFEMGALKATLKRDTVQIKNHYKIKK